MKTIRSLFNREDTAGIMFTLPFTLGFLFFMIVPMVNAVYLSFTIPFANIIFCPRLFLQVLITLKI